jgi:D-glycero-alpha-D-manno-heptose 1-phosphate guanylyltransferase
MKDAKNKTMAVILLGGKGTRIQSLYGDRPKCLVPVAGKPILLWQLEWLSRSGVKRVHLAAGYMADVLRDWLKTDAPKDMEITFSVEPEPRGTGGAIKFAEPWIQSDPFFVLNGDSLTPNLDFQTLEKAHRNGSNNSPSPASGHPSEGGDSLSLCLKSPPGRGAGLVRRSLGEGGTAGWVAPWITLAVAQIEKTGRYGTVEFDGENRVTAFLEKAERENGWINTGVYCISRRALEAIAPDKNISIETDIFPPLAAEGLLRVFLAEPPMLDMGTPDGLAAMEKFLT